MIEVRGLTKRYGDTLAVNCLTFEVEPGRVTGFLGPNGAGKSTTMRMILGLDRATAGQALIDGRPYTSLREPLRHVGAALESDAFHPGRTARNHLLVAARTNGIQTGRVDEVLEQVGLAAVSRRRVKTYSLGMRQRLGIAAALLGDPGVLLFDEPANGLDADGVMWVRELVRGLAAEGRTVLVSSHLMSEMQRTADHLVVIGRGQLIADEPITDVLARSGRTVLVRTPLPDVLELRLAMLGAKTERLGDRELRVTGASTEHIGDTARDAGVALHELTEVVSSLEQIYMQLTADKLDYAAASIINQETTAI